MAQWKADTGKGENNVGQIRIGDTPGQNPHSTGPKRIRFSGNAFQAASNKQKGSKAEAVLCGLAIGQLDRAI
jgi:hypothetical protein